ncbi:PQQ-dependent sugar dehydrogenase [Pseudoteredinibacter isoporae]|uniref:Glucose/arabinose dehydrogenase n=1 Tax=Pseudoteredinibacter isoporae TaxID=570281 RepID=A0A7X0JQK7_9GAMM|nr:PQQ-dependent sugar dehydrogenase [Pseudoteredinibacter isoporae]MBB6520467.1 glucose/arabinose dehydrogenase [Pseudoteredinibacter isoporae]NHO86034.1 PQQ-dependent sugar dehydrogenase [Pseudoteredinibacter isoporae]NIB25515.1 PQQ-dependent sugar dehydrogenase [Pseudoteredinibacter isoporae]
MLKSMISASLLVAAGLSHATEFQVKEVAKDLNRPWGMSFINGYEALVTEKGGKVKRLDLRTGKHTEVTGLPDDIYVYGQGGLLDVNLNDNGYAYFTYSKRSEQPEMHGRTALARAKLDGNRLLGWEDLVVTESDTETGRHYGSRVVFDGKGALYFGVGDRAKRQPAQDNSNHIGTLLRVDLQGKALTDNPFYGDKNVQPEIYSFGHRNPQGLAFDAEGQLWEIEHGPRGGDEINKIVAGQNYGWPVVSFGKEYREDKMVGEATHKEGMQDAAKVYVPSIAPSSLMIYSGKVFSEWRGDFFAGALAQTHVNRLRLNAEDELLEQERLLDDASERIRDVQEGPEGFIYLLTDSGKLLQLSPK